MDKNSSGGVPLLQRYGAILTIVLGLIIAMLGGAIVNVVFPTIASDLNALPAASIWIVNAYQIAIVIALLSFSFLGDMVGYCRIYKIGPTVFVLTSLACALSHSLDMLAFVRVTQGLGDTALMSVNTVLTRLIYPQRFLGCGMGISPSVITVSLTAGPAVATTILSLAPWQWLSLINILFGTVAFVLAMHFLPPDSARSRITRFDLPNAIADALTSELLITAPSGPAQGQSVQLVLAGVAAMLVMGFFFVRHQLSMPVPLLPIDLLHTPFFPLSIYTPICSFCAQMLMMVFSPFFLQTVTRHSEVETGLLLTSWPLTTMVMVPLADYLVEKCHAGLLGAIGLLVMTCDLSGLVLLPESPSNLDIIWRVALCGAGFGPFQSSNNHTIIASVPGHRSGGISEMLGAVRLPGQSIGAVLVALLFNPLGNSGTHTTLLLTGILAIVAALISGLYVTQPCVA